MVSEFVLAAYRRQIFVYAGEDAELDPEATLTALRALQAQALSDHQQHVAITAMSFADGGSSSGTVTGQPETILEVTELLIREVGAIVAEEDPYQAPDRVYHTRFRHRRFET